MFYYRFNVIKSQHHGHQRISQKYIWPETTLRDGCVLVVVDEDDDFLPSYRRKLDFYISSELRADVAPGVKDDKSEQKYDTRADDEEAAEIMTKLV